MTDADIIAVLEARLAQAIKSRDWTQEWYSVRLERLKDLMKQHGIWKDGAAIIANASLSGDRGNDYWQQLNVMRHRAEQAEARNQKLEKTLRELVEAFNPEPVFSDEPLTIWDRAAKALASK